MSEKHGFMYRRPELLKALMADLTGNGQRDFSSGIFLAGPRRTGKTTFLRGELVPELDNQGIATVYADLWTRRDQDPAVTIKDAIEKAIRDTQPGLVGALRAAGTRSLNLGVVKADLDKMSLPDGGSIASLVSALAKRRNQRVAVILDEAQHTSDTMAGQNAMFGLKAARDEMALRLGSKGGPGGLILVFTGSNRDKLANMVLDNREPFFGAALQDFPTLGREFALSYGTWLQTKFRKGHFPVKDVVQAFVLLWERPEELRKAIDATINEGGSVLENAELIRTKVFNHCSGLFNERPPLERAIMLLLADGGEPSSSGSPYGSAGLRRLSEITGRTIKAQAVQTALERLRAENQVWRSGRGVYGLEDDHMRDWLLRARPEIGDDGNEKPAASKMIAEIIGQDVSIALLARLTRVQRPTLMSWRDGTSPRDRNKMSRLASLHSVLTRSGMPRWNEAKALVPDLELRLSRNIKTAAVFLESVFRSPAEKNEKEA